MALHSKQEFAALCGLPTKNLATYIGRGKVIIGKNDMVDATNPTNADFLKRRQGQRKTGVPGDLPDETSEKPQKAGKKSKKSNEKGQKADEPDDLYAADLKKKLLDVDKAEQEKQIRNVTIQKLHGKLIPTDGVKDLFSTHFRNVTIAFKQSVDIIVAEIGQKAKLNTNQLAEIKAKMIKSINHAVESAAQASKKDLENMVDDYSDATKKNAA